MNGAVRTSDISMMVTAIATMRTANNRHAATGDDRINSRSPRT